MKAINRQILLNEDYLHSVTITIIIIIIIIIIIVAIIVINIETCLYFKPLYHRTSDRHYVSVQRNQHH